MISKCKSLFVFILACSLAVSGCGIAGGGEQAVAETVALSESSDESSAGEASSDGGTRTSDGSSGDGLSEANPSDPPSGGAADAGDAESDGTAADTEEEDAPADKSESVHVEADALGNPTKVTVSATLKNPGGTQNITDLSSLTDIKNKEGDEEYTFDANGKLVWENHGEDITYEGLSDKSLPVSVKVSYYLDGAEISPEDLAGKSGHVKVRFDYENHTTKTVEVKGAEHQVPVPFLAISAAFLPGDTFENVKITNGKVMSMDDQNIILGIALPGLEKALHLTTWEPTEEVEIPEYVEWEADATDFELAFTATILSNHLLEDLKEDDLTDIDDMIDGMDELADAVDELADGSGEMADALWEFKDYVKKYTDGVSAIDEGIQGLDDGIQTLDKNKSGLEEGAKGLRDGLKELNKGLSAMDFSSSDDPDSQAIGAALQRLAADGKSLQKLLNDAGMSDDDMAAYAREAAAYVKAVRKAVEESDQDLSKIRFADIEMMLTKKAQAQADAALQAALGGTGLSEEEQEDIRAAVADAINLTGLTEDAAAHLKSANAGFADLPELAPPEVKVDETELNTLLDDMSDQADVLLDHTDTLGEMAEGLLSLNDSLSELKKGVSALYKGSGQLTKGISAFNEGIGTLADGSSKLASGSSELAGAGGELTDGAEEVAKAMDEMTDGIREFRDEGVSELTDLAGDDLQRIVNTIRALQKSDIGYDNFTGLEEGKTGEVRFIIETAEIKAE